MEEIVCQYMPQAEKASKTSMADGLRDTGSSLHGAVPRRSIQKALAQRRLKVKAQHVLAQRSAEDLYDWTV